MTCRKTLQQKFCHEQYRKHVAECKILEHIYDDDLEKFKYYMVERRNRANYFSRGTGNKSIMVMSLSVLWGKSCALFSAVEPCSISFIHLTVILAMRLSGIMLGKNYSSYTDAIKNVVWMELFLTADETIAENVLNPCQNVNAQALSFLLQGLLWMAGICATQIPFPFYFLGLNGSEILKYIILSTC